jgi:hypothetical protein
MLRVIILSDIMLIIIIRSSNTVSFTMLSDANKPLMLIVVMLNVIFLIVIILSVIRLIVKKRSTITLNDIHYAERRK